MIPHTFHIYLKAVVTKTRNGTRNTEHEIWNTEYTEHGIQNTENGIIYTEHGIRNIYVHTKKIKAMGINVLTIRRLGNGTSQFRPGDNANMAEAMLHVKDFKQRRKVTNPLYGLV